jgi:hypothetical protein
LPTPGAVEAKAIYANELATARAEYDRGVQAARREYLTALEAEKLSAMGAGAVGTLRVEQD